MGNELVQGTLDMLVLKILALAPMHGWGITQRIEQMSQGVFQLIPGSLYPALQRLKRQGKIHSFWSTTENNRRARYYELTPAGRLQLEEETERWERVSAAVNRIVRTAH